MLKKLFGISKGLRIFGESEVDVIEGSVDPSVEPGRKAPMGTLYLRHDGISYKKIGPNDTDWVSASTTTNAGAGFIYVTDVTPQNPSNNVGNKIYIPDTVPSNKVVEECTTDTVNVRIHFLAEGGVNYSPTIILNGQECTNLQQFENDKRLFFGSFDVTLSVDPDEYETFTLVSSTTQSATVKINLAGEGPQITDITFGSYPGTQTALKSGDIIPVTVTVENDATLCQILSGKASNSLVTLTLDSVDSAGAGYRYATGNIIISSISNDSPVDAQAENALGTKGNIYTSSNLTIDQSYPVITLNDITYPSGQEALKNDESAIVDVTVTNFDEITYSSSQLTIPEENTYSETKSVERTSGDYNVSTPNYHISATKTSNDATTTDEFIVQIAHVAAELSISLPASRLRTGGTGYSNVGLTSSASVAEHTITINSNQQLISVPTLADPDADKGEWKNGSFANAGGMTSFTNILEVSDDSTHGTHDWGAISGTNLAGIETTVITGDDDYEIGGFMPRYYPLTLGHNTTTGDVEVTNYNKLTLDWQYRDGSGQIKALFRHPTINEDPPVTNKWTIEEVGVNPTKIIILDTAATEAQTVDSSILVEEEV